MEKSVRQRILEISVNMRLEKHGKNEHLRSEYFKPDDILKYITPILLENSLFMHFDMLWKGDIYSAVLEIADLEKPEEKEIYTFDIHEAMIHGGNPAMNGGATMTYGKRYSIMNAFNIADNNADAEKYLPEKKAKKEDGEQLTKLKQELRKLGAENMTQAIKKLNDKTGSDYKKFPDDEKTCQVLLTKLIQNGKN